MFRTHHHGRPPPPLFPFSHSRSTVHSMAARTGWKKGLCRASADSSKPPHPNSPLLRFPTTGRQAPSAATLQATAHAVGCRLAWLDCGRSAPPPFDCPISTDSGKKERGGQHEERARRKHGKVGLPRGRFEATFRCFTSLFLHLPAKHLVLLCPLLWTNSLAAWQAWHALVPSPFRVVAGRRRLGGGQKSRISRGSPASPVGQAPAPSGLFPPPLLLMRRALRRKVGGRVIRSACGTRICGWLL